MPINMTMQKPRACIVSSELNCHVIILSGESRIDGVSSDGIVIIIICAPCDSYYIKDMSMQMEWMLSNTA